MNRSLLTCVLFAFATAAVYAQQPAQPDQYQGQANPPADETITAQPDQPDQPDQPAKPRAGTPLVQPARSTAQPTPVTNYGSEKSVNPSVNYGSPASGSGSDNGIVSVGNESGMAQPTLSTRQFEDPDGDIVHPHPLAPGEVAEGTRIRVRLLTGLSTSHSEPGEMFQSHVASDVLQDGQVLIPAGSEIDGRVVEVSEGHTGGHGSMRLRPDTVILPDGRRYRMDAQVSGAPGSRTRVDSEGTINAGSRWKKDGIEYGAAVGGGAVTGAVIAGPVGALTGSLIGAGAITVHLLTDHPQAKLEPGTVLLITLNSRLNLVATTTATN